MAQKYKEYLAGVENPDALQFLLTFYSGQTKKGYDPQAMFAYFIIYIKNIFGESFAIEENNANYKEFCQYADGDGSLAVDLKELSDFFTKFVKVTEGQIVGLKMAENLKASKSPSKKEEAKGGQMVATGKSVHLKMKVLEDFDKEKKEYDEEREMEGILHKDDEKDLILEDGQQMKFGRDPLNEVVIPLKEGDIDDVQFSIYNRDGMAYLVDQFQTGEATRIKCELNTKYRLNTNDYVSLGLT